MTAGVIVLVAALATWIDVPFTKQEKNGCGSASVWMLMEYWGKSPAAPAEIQRALYSEEAGGIFASDLERFLAAQGFKTFSFEGEWNDLVENVAKGRPLIVSIEANSRGTPLHYVLVAGVDEPGQIVLLNDPAQRKLLPMSRSDFERQWEAMQRWTLLAVPEDGAAPPPRPGGPAVDSKVSDPALEEATSAFRAGDLGTAKRLMRRTAHAAAAQADPLRNEFLATLYFLEGNLEAALKYWNRNGSPRLREVVFDFESRWNPILLDHTVGISRATVLRDSDYRLAQKRLDATATVSRHAFELTPVEGDAFDLKLRAAERQRWNYLGFARGLPYRTVMPEMTNLGGQAINVAALWRWDVNRRRIQAETSGPVSASTRFIVGVDARNEIWDWQGEATPVRVKEFKAGLSRVATSRWTWMSGIVIGRREVGTSLKYAGDMDYDLVRIPEHRLAVSGNLQTQFGGVPSKRERMARGQVGLELTWQPQATGDDYAVATKLSAGRIWGTTALDELFAVGFDRDTALWLRAHPVMNNGRKGMGLITRRYLLSNSEISRRFLDKTLVSARVVPFVDIARVGRVFVDAGAEIRISIASLFTLSVGMGRDVQSGKNAVFTNIKTN